MTTSKIFRMINSLLLLDDRLFPCESTSQTWQGFPRGNSVGMNAQDALLAPSTGWHDCRTIIKPAALRSHVPMVHNPQNKPIVRLHALKSPVIYSISSPVLRLKSWTLVISFRRRCQLVLSPVQQFPQPPEARSLPSNGYWPVASHTNHNSSTSPLPRRAALTVYRDTTAA